MFSLHSHYVKKVQKMIIIYIYIYICANYDIYKQSIVGLLKNGGSDYAHTYYRLFKCIQ